MTVAAVPRPHILLTGAYPEWDMVPLEQAYEVHRLWATEQPDAWLAEHGASIRALATRGELGASPALIQALPALELIACYGVGTDAIALPAARSRGIRVTNTPDVLSGDVADLAVGLALALLRRIPAADAFVRRGAWAAGPMELVTRLYGKRVGLVGLGRIGATLARRLSGFDVELGYHSRTVRPASALAHWPDLTALAAWADVLIVTLSGGPATRGLIDAAVLHALGPNGWLVNVSRGSTVDEDALVQALQSRSVAGAALDVFCNEPHLDARLLTLDNVVLSPHHASGTVETRRAMGQLVRDNLAAHFAGRPLLTPVD